jgi:hypothetical protein
LLDGAEALFTCGDPRMLRGAVLEAITALEAFVKDTVFSALDGRLDPLLVKWLEERTKMDFDARLSVLTPVATGRKIDKQSSLWNDYKRAKRIRNTVTHTGARVTTRQARFVIDTVYGWLGHLGSTAELVVALSALKRYIEHEAPDRVSSEKEGISLVHEYFGRTKAASAVHEPRGAVGGVRPDLLLTFGDYQVLVEAKYARGGRTRAIVETAVQQVSRYMEIFGVPNSAVVVFQRGELEPGFDTVRRYLDSKVYVVVISVGC